MRVGVNGLGRIGRSVTRQLLELGLDQIVINDVNPDINNHAYLLEFDTLYGRLGKTVSVVDENRLAVEGSTLVFHSESRIDRVPWENFGVDVVVDASGVAENVSFAKFLVERSSVNNVIITHSPGVDVDFTLVVGVNDDDFDPEIHKVISSSICDVNGVAPIVHLCDSKFGLVSGELVTLHPWLQYQNLLDGSLASVESPGHSWKNYSLGRGSIESLIPKETTVIPALERVLPNVRGKLHAMSFRVPTSSVACARGFLDLSHSITREDILSVIHQDNLVGKRSLTVNDAPLVSIDFKGCKVGGILDMRFTSMVSANRLAFLVWYDNEFGYASRVVDCLLRINRKN